MIKFLQKKFFKNAAIYTLSDVLNKMVPFVLLPVLTRYLTPSDYGVISVFFVFTAVLGVFMTLETNTAISVSFFKLSREELKIYIANVLLIISIATSLVFLIFGIFSEYFTVLLALPTEWLFIGIIVTLLQFFTTINLVLWQSEHKPIPFGIYQITQTILNLSLSIILIVGLGLGWEGRLIAVSLASLVFGIMSLSFLFKRNFLNFKLNKFYIKDALKFGLPLVPHALSVTVRNGVEKVFLTILISSSATGLFTVGFQIASIVTILATSFNKAFIPYLFEKLKKINNEQKQELVKYTYFYFISLLILALLLSLSAPFIIDVFLGKDYEAAQQYVSWIVFGMAFYGMYSLIVNYILFTKRTKFLSYVTIAIGILHIGLSYLLININGAIGAAQSSAIISFLTLIFVWILSQKLYPMPWFKFVNY